MKQVKTHKGQSLIDIAIQEYGDISGVELLLEDNDPGLCDYIPAGTTLEIRETVTNPLVKAALEAKKIQPNSSVTELHGIGQWAIEVNFEIQ